MPKRKSAKPAGESKEKENKRKPLNQLHVHVSRGKRSLSEEAAPAAAPPKKRVYRKLHEKPDGYVRQVSVLRVALSSVLSENLGNRKQLLTQILDQFILYWSQVLSVTWMVTKLHLLGLLQSKKPLGFKLDGRYFILALSLVSSRNLRGASLKLPYYKTLDKAMKTVKTSLGEDNWPTTPELMVDDVRIPLAIPVNQAINYSSTQMAVNLLVHIKNHAQRFINTFVHNRLVLLLSEAHYNDVPFKKDDPANKTARKSAAKQRSSTLKKIKDFVYPRIYKKKDPPTLAKEFKYLRQELDKLVSEVQTLKQRLDDAYTPGDELEAENAGADTVDLESLIAILFDMLAKVERLNATKSRQIRLIQLVPQGRMRMVSVRMDSRFLSSFATAFATAQEVADDGKAAAPAVAPAEVDVGDAGAQGDGAEAKPGEEKAATLSEEYEKIWRVLFNTDKIKGLKNASFDYACITNGLSASLQYSVAVPKRAKWAKEAKFPLNTLKPGFPIKETRVQTTREELKTRDIIAIDTGLKRPITCVNLKTSETYTLRSNRWMHRSGAKVLKKWMSNTFNKKKLKRLSTLGSQAPYRHTVDAKKYKKLLEGVGERWQEQWDFMQRRKVRQVLFRAANKQQGAIAREVNSVVQLAKPAAAAAGSGDGDGDGVAAAASAERALPIVIIGNSGNGGKFMRLKGRHKAPVNQIQRELSKRAIVVSCDEFGTSQCCLCCGFAVKHMKRWQTNKENKRVLVTHSGVSYCDKSKTHWNRDQDAARKIGFRCVGSWLGLHLGPLSRDRPSTWSKNEHWTEGCRVKWRKNNSVSQLYKLEQLSREEQRANGGSPSSRRIVVRCLI